MSSALTRRASSWPATAADLQHSRQLAPLASAYRSTTCCGMRFRRAVPPSAGSSPDPMLARALWIWNRSITGPARRLTSAFGSHPKRRVRFVLPIVDRSAAGTTIRALNPPSRISDLGRQPCFKASLLSHSDGEQRRFAIELRGNNHLGKVMAERVGFEPTVPSRVRRISSAVRSTTLPPLRRSSETLRTAPPIGRRGPLMEWFRRRKRVWRLFLVRRKTDPRLRICHDTTVSLTTLPLPRSQPR